MELQSLKIELPIDTQVILAQSHFTKTDFHMYFVLMFFINFISHGSRWKHTTFTLSYGRYWRLGEALIKPQLDILNRIEELAKKHSRIK